MMYPTNGHSTPAPGEGHAAVYKSQLRPGDRPDGDHVNLGQGNGFRTDRVGTNERPVGELFQELANETRNLVSLEVELAKTEMTEKVAAAGKDVGFIAAGGFVAYAGFIVFLAFIGFGLANFIPLWLSFLIVGVVVMLAGYLLVRKGLDGLKSRSMAPEKTIASLKHDKEWLQGERSR